MRLPVGVRDLFILVAVGSAKPAVESRMGGWTERAFAVLDEDKVLEWSPLEVV